MKSMLQKPNPLSHTNSIISSKSKDLHHKIQPPGSKKNKTSIKVNISNFQHLKAKLGSFKSPHKPSTHNTINQVEEADESPKSKLKRLFKPKPDIFTTTNIAPNNSLNLDPSNPKLGEGSLESSLHSSVQLPSPTMLKLPLKVDKSLLKLSSYLTEKEKLEVNHYETIYYINMDAKQVEKKLRRQDELEYDDDNNDYRLISGEHIAYRYQIVDRYALVRFNQYFV